MLFSKKIGLYFVKQFIIYSRKQFGSVLFTFAHQNKTDKNIKTNYIKMADNKTFTMIKPDAVSAGNSGAIIKMIEENGFKIKAMKYTRLSLERAGQFYEIHKERPFYKDLCAYMSSGTIIPIILEKENAIESFRTLIGATNPQEAAEGTIRNLFAESISANAIHGSDSDENAEIEGNFFFPEIEKF